MIDGDGQPDQSLLACEAIQTDEKDNAHVAHVALAREPAMRDVERQLDAVADCSRAALRELIGRTKRILSQKPKDKNRLYALRAPEVECLAKGKARIPYEFGVKVSVATTLS